jgi:predicted RecA/RadA family phage recombinase
MADIALDTADRVEVVESRRQHTAPALEAIEAGAPVRIDPTTGKFRNGNGTDMTEGPVYGIALRSVAAGEAVTALNSGVLDGFALSGMNYNAPVYLSDTDGRIADAAGTKAILIGRVIGGHANVLGDNPEKLLDVNVAHHAVVS